MSFIETGRSRPSPELLLRLCDELDVPLRARNEMLLAAGYAPAYRERPLSSPDLAAVRTAVRGVLIGHEPYPAVLVDRHWTLLESNAALPVFLDGVAPHLLEPPVNVLRVSLHPEGMAPRIANLGQWRAHVLHRLRRQVAATADPTLAALHHELAGLPCDEPTPRLPVPAADSVVLPLRYRVGEATLSFLTITAVLGTPLDVTVDELAIESFYPADAFTADYLRH